MRRRAQELTEYPEIGSRGGPWRYAVFVQIGVIEMTQQPTESFLTQAALRIAFLRRARMPKQGPSTTEHLHRFMPPVRVLRIGEELQEVPLTLFADEGTVLAEHAALAFDDPVFADIDDPASVKPPTIADTEDTLLPDIEAA